MLTTAELAKMLDVTVSTLERWRREDKGPRFIQLENRVIRYRPEDVDAWIAGRSDGKPDGLGQ